MIQKRKLDAMLYLFANPYVLPRSGCILCLQTKSPWCLTRYSHNVLSNLVLCQDYFLNIYLHKTQSLALLCIICSLGTNINLTMYVLGICVASIIDFIHQKSVDQCKSSLISRPDLDFRGLIVFSQTGGSINSFSSKLSQFKAA